VKLAVFDLENTLIYNEFLPELAREVGLQAEVARITQEGIDGRIEWAEGFVLRAAMLAGIPRRRVLELARDLRVVPGALGFVRGLKARGLKVALVTGGPEEVAQEAKALFDADCAFANQFIYEDGHFTGRVKVLVTPEVKGRLVEDTGRRLGIGREGIIAFADGLMDLHLLAAAGVRVGINAGGKLRGRVDYEALDFHDAYEWLVARGYI
jgi:phosphoserine phosphatase SerB